MFVLTLWIISRLRTPDWSKDSKLRPNWPDLNLASLLAGLLVVAVGVFLGLHFEAVTWWWMTAEMASVPLYLAIQTTVTDIKLYKAHSLMLAVGIVLFGTAASAIEITSGRSLWEIPIATVVVLAASLLGARFINSDAYAIGLVLLAGYIAGPPVQYFILATPALCIIAGSLVGVYRPRPNYRMPVVPFLLIPALLGVSTSIALDISFALQLA